MKRIFVLLMVALMSVVIVNAKTVRGYVSDKDGNPVVGMKMVVARKRRARCNLRAQPRMGLRYIATARTRTYTS